MTPNDFYVLYTTSRDIDVKYALDQIFSYAEVFEWVIENITRYEKEGQFFKKTTLIH